MAVFVCSFSRATLLDVWKGHGKPENKTFILDLQNSIVEVIDGKTKINCFEWFIHDLVTHFFCHSRVNRVNQQWSSICYISCLMFADTVKLLKETQTIIDRRTIRVKQYILSCSVVNLQIIMRTGTAVIPLFRFNVQELEVEHDHLLTMKNVNVSLLWRSSGIVK